MIVTVSDLAGVGLAGGIVHVTPAKARPAGAAAAPYGAGFCRTAHLLRAGHGNPADATNWFRYT
jgi:hypothetical protein